MARQTTSQTRGSVRLAGLMRERDLRAEDIASKLYVSHRTVTRWLDGSTEPTPTSARALGALFDVDWRLFYEKEAA